MPTLDERLTRALHDGEHRPTSDARDVLDRVASKRRHRLVRRRAGIAGLVAGALGSATLGTIASVTRDSVDVRVATETGREVPAPDGTGATLEIVVGGKRVAVEEIAVAPDVGYVRGPLLDTTEITSVTGRSGELVWAAGYDRSGDTYTFPPSHVVAIDTATGDVVARIDLQGEIQSLTQDGDLLWAVTRDRDIDPDGTEFRLKRVELGPQDSVVGTDPVPGGEVPAGPVWVGGGRSPQIPTRDGILRFDVGTGAFVKKLPAAPTERRLTGATSAGAPAPIAALAAVDLPGGYKPVSLVSTDRGLVVTGFSTSTLDPVVLVVEGTKILRTLALPGATDVAVASLDNGELVFTAGGRLYRGDLP